MSQIVPKNKAPGSDFCGQNTYNYIVRSDLGCFMRSSDFVEGKDIGVFPLHTSCQGGAHYLAHEDDSFYIINRDNYRCVTNLDKGDDAVVYNLHPNCQGGDHYLFAFGYFYIIFQDRGVYRRVSNMNTDENGDEYTLYTSCKNGVYYWGVKDYCCFVKQHEASGIQFVRCASFLENPDTDICRFNESVVPFIPGGLAINKGPAFGKWEAIKIIPNDSDGPKVWENKIIRKVGYNRMKMNGVEQNWKTSMGTSYKPGALAEAIAKYQFSLSVQYGGVGVQTKQEDWSNITEVEEFFHVTLQPKSQMYIWQYQLGFGNEPILFCRDLMFTSDSTPPTTVPLPLSNK
ncbi:uncharacterized protein LOC132583843 isoform X1 [Heteronotia binoei]|uniref:uncharacterized protein LOC132583843 isoform X1 n=1 Tax=Heteronotia binoei TaxID=13085 RepID=UPI002930DFF8|nr:uncharacterized protein LOC132583843 isoform X1 [Heteronotia binoei]